MDELLQKLNDAKVRYLLLGGQAMRLFGMPRFSMDWDFFIPPKDDSNFSCLNELLNEELDLPLLPLGPKEENFLQTYQTRWGILQYHLGVTGVPPFTEAEKAAVIRSTENGFSVKCLSGAHLLAAKEAANRPQDQGDLEFLREMQRVGKLR